MSIQDLALLGGAPACLDVESPKWPVTTDEDVEAVVGTLRSGILVADRNVFTDVDRFEREWASYVGAKHCVAVSNGTVAIEMALRAVGVQPGDEVIVPTLSFVASAMAVAAIGAVPIYADISTTDFNILPDLIEPLISARTRAILIVHLHGQPAQMAEIMATAAKHDLPVVEDAAQAQGGFFNGQHCGTLGAAGTFSLQMTKNLPTCGEGGMIVTDDETLAVDFRRRRQFGELIQPGEPRSYTSEMVASNAKMNAIQAAYASSQLRRFPDADERRKHNVSEFLESLQGLPHLRVPQPNAGTVHAWHILRFATDADGPLMDVAPRQRRMIFMKALAAEGVPVSRYQTLALPEQPALRSLTAQSPSEWKNAKSVINETFVLQQRHLNPEAGSVLAAYAEAFRKVFSSSESLRGAIR